ncbi:MAG: penicillin-binding protein 2, partial [Gammaproteobacteria bacterium RIFCSPHIGHO2_12_FULL_45_9]
MAAVSPPKQHLQQHEENVARFSERALFSFIMAAILCLVLITRLAYLQIQNHQFYHTLSQANILNVLPIAPARGLIYDRNGVLLATNIPSYTLAIIPDKVKSTADAIKTIRHMMPVSEAEIRKFRRIRSQYHRFQPIPLKRKLTEEEVARYYVDRFRLPGIVIEARSTRQYPLGSISAHLTGYVAQINTQELRRVDSGQYDISDDIGKTGVEKQYESVLHGTVGAEEVEIDAAGRIVRTLNTRPPIAGNDLYLSIDSQLETRAIQILEALGDESGSIVAINPQNGEILTMVSHPSFDPNLFAVGIDPKTYSELLNSPLHPLYNRALWSQFASGSTIKPFYALNGLDAGIITPDYTISDPGFWRLPNSRHVYHDWVKHGHGLVNVTKAITLSCDTYFYGLAYNTGITRMARLLSIFGFGKPTGVDLPGEKSGILPSPAWKQKAVHQPWYMGDTIEVGIGQGYFNVTPLQLAQAAATLGNRGARFIPHVVAKTVDATG